MSRQSDTCTSIEAKKELSLSLSQCNLLAFRPILSSDFFLFAMICSKLENMAHFVNSLTLTCTCMFLFLQIEYQIGSSEKTSASREQDVSLHATVQGVLRKAEAGLKHGRKQGTEKTETSERYSSEMVVLGHEPDPDTLVIPRADNPAMLDHVLRPICDVIPVDDWDSETRSLCKEMFQSEAFCFSQLPDSPNPDNGNTETLEFLFEAKKHFQCGEAAIPMVGYKMNLDAAHWTPATRRLMNQENITTQWECAMACMRSSTCAVANFVQEQCFICNVQELRTGNRRNDVNKIVRNEHCLASIIPCRPDVPCSVFVRKMSQALQEEMPRADPPIVKSFHLGMPLFQASRVIGDVVGRNTHALRIHKKQNMNDFCDFFRDHTIPDERVVPSEVMDGYATGFAMKCMESRPGIAADGLAVRIQVEAGPCFMQKKPAAGTPRNKLTMAERTHLWLKQNHGGVQSVLKVYASGLAGEEFEEENSNSTAMARRIFNLFFKNGVFEEDMHLPHPKTNETDRKSGTELLGILQILSPLNYWSAKILYKQAARVFNEVHEYMYPSSDDGKHKDDPEPDYVRIVGTCDFYDSSQVMIEHRHNRFCENDKFCNMKNGQFFKTGIFELKG